MSDMTTKNYFGKKPEAVCGVAMEGSAENMDAQGDDREAVRGADVAGSAEMLAAQRAFFRSGRTLDVDFRIRMLKKLYKAISENSGHLTNALTADLGKSEAEGFMCEVGLLLGEIRHQIRHVRKWTAPRRKVTDLVNSFGTSMTVTEPLGNVLIMAPWNYPVLLCLAPLVGAVAAGNTVILKPSAYAPESSRAIRTLLEKVFDPAHVWVKEGGREENAELLNLRFDHIFFTGSVAVGKVVMAAAAKNLTPITLELGGKSPVYVDRTADIGLSAKRIVFGKLLNSGQTCIAPDYILVDACVHGRLIEALKKQLARQCPEPFAGTGFARMINKKHFDRVKGLIDPEKVVYGGRTDEGQLKIEPTLLDKVSPEDAVMQEEIFGPLLPVIPVSGREEAEAFIKGREKPLALYLFTRSKAVERHFLRAVPFGGGCVNDTIVHILSSRLPFGGVGNSGMGKYHGEYSYRTFTNEKAVHKKYLFPDLPMRYTPYGKVNEALIRFIQAHF